MGRNQCHRSSLRAHALFLTPPPLCLTLLLQAAVNYASVPASVYISMYERVCTHIWMMDTRWARAATQL